MATFLFWNINNKLLVDEIVALCHAHEVDVLILAESQISEVKLLQALNRGQESVYLAPFNPSRRLSFFIKYPEKSLEPVYDEGGISIRRISPPIGLGILLVALHLPSKLYMNENEQMLFSTRAIEAINLAESNEGHSNSLVIGDFNMNPFEASVVASEGFHAVMDRKIAARMARNVQGREKKFFYNPMWSKMGDASIGPPGTYYRGAGVISYFWNTFDQVLIRPSLLKFFSDEQLSVLTEIKGKNLLSDVGISSSFSDHLPILLTLKIERGD